MPDTGAPWNIPYVASTDLVSDWPTDSQELADAIADGLDGLANVVSAAKADVFSSTSATFEDITGLSVSITPTTNTSKVLVIASVAASNSSNFADGTELQLVRNSTNIFLGTGGSTTNQTEFVAGSNLAVNRYTAVFLDSPATTSATTYKMQIRVLGSSTGYINRRGADATRGVPSSITVIEVPA